MKDIPRKEFPFPQFQRENWVNLNGEWDFEFDFDKTGIKKNYQNKKEFSEKITVPFCPESELSGIAYKDFIKACWYHRTIEITPDRLDGRVFIHFGAVDYEATLFVNGKKVGSHKGGYVSFSFDITNHLVSGENHLVLYVLDDTKSPVQPTGKQSEKKNSYGCLYTRTTGIWQTVWLEFTPKSYIISAKYYPNITDGTLTVQAKVHGNGEFIAEAYYENEPCGSAKCTIQNGTGFLQIKLSQLHLWEVGKGRLYGLVLKFNNDKVNSYFGMREVRLDGYKFLINNNSVFQRLVLDQGFYPDGIYTARDEETLKKDIELSLAAGFNGARLHQKVFEPRFLYHCDKMGYIVWGEMASWGIDHSKYTAYEGFIPEWLECLQRDFNHPSIIGWCPLNETWNIKKIHRQLDSFLENVYKTTKAFDPTRPCIDTSGNFHVITDIYDVHDYEQDPKVFLNSFEAFGKGEGPFRDPQAHRQTYTEGLPMFVSEYGGIRWSVKSDNKKAWGYGNAPKTQEEYLSRYKGLTEALLFNPKMFGFCYTQLTDVEQEQNGVYTYSREPKFDIEFFKNINSQKAAIEE